MRLIRVGEEYYLEHGSRTLPLDEKDVVLLSRMTPLGRKVHFRKKGKDMLSARGESPEAGMLMEWSGLPAREWAFETASAASR